MFIISTYPLMTLPMMSLNLHIKMIPHLSLPGPRDPYQSLFAPKRRANPEINLTFNKCSILLENTSTYNYENTFKKIQLVKYGWKLQLNSTIIKLR